MVKYLINYLFTVIQQLTIIITGEEEGESAKNTKAGVENKDKENASFRLHVP